MPIKDKICILSIDCDHVYEIKFHGKPVKIVPLINSNKLNKIEKYIINETLLSTYFWQNIVAKPIKTDKNNGIIISATGIKIVKDSSNVSEIVIQWILLKK